MVTLPCLVVTMHVTGCAILFLQCCSIFGSVFYIYCCTLFTTLYSTAQLQGNVCTCLKRMQDASRMHVRRVQNACKMHPECTWDASMQVQNLAIKLQQDHALVHQDARCFRNMHEVHLERMQNASGMCAECVWDACKCYLEAELYCNVWINVKNCYKLHFTVILMLPDLLFYRFETTTFS